MSPEITVFLPSGSPEDLHQSILQLLESGTDARIVVLVEDVTEINTLPQGVEILHVPSLFSSEAVKKISLATKSEYTVLYTRKSPLKLGQFALQRMLQVAAYTYSGMIYSDYQTIKDGITIPAPVIEYQDGSLRDDFNFGSLLFFETASLLEAVSRMKENYLFAGLYDLRLKLSQKYLLTHIPEYLYTETESDARKSGEKLFDYVNPKNRQVQIEMEHACNEHLKDTGAWLEPRFRKVQFDEIIFPVEISVIIPVRNRVKTIGDAITSVITQQFSFSFNLLVVDNHSNDGTSDIIQSFSRKDSRIIHIIPPRKDLGIGGCWNEALFHPLCGKFSVQLDSDDLYIDDNVLEKVLRAFYEQNCAMLIGSYRMVNFKLEEIPPGIIDHKEWTPENGRNNALRINGLGAPRAFYTPVIRSIRMPNVSYGEDYAIGLNISRFYQIGRIYEPLYLCRRWEENSDASLDISKMNTYNFYKDKIRTIEFRARQQYIQEGQEV
jgi:hypothetical protein